MRSVPLATIWELFSHRWSLIGAALGANFFPILLLTALRRDGQVPAQDSSMILMHVILIQGNMFFFGMAMIGSQGSPSRLYTYPMTAAAIVACHFLPLMVLMGLELVVSTAILNAVFHLDWPVWGPALLVAVAIPAIQATLWWTEKSSWLPWGMMVVGGIFGIWFKARYGPAFSTPDHYWTLITPGETAFLAIAAIGSFVLAVPAVSRNRRGEPMTSLGIMAWLDRMLEPASISNPSFASATRAQAWYEWRKKGWAMPAIAIFALLMGCCGWLVFNRNLDELLVAFIAGGGFLSIGGLIGGLVMGNTGTSDVKYEIGSFLATRPVSTPDMARNILRVAAQSVLVTWLIWATALSSLYLILLASGFEFGAKSMELFSVVGWWYLPATLVGFWTVVGVGTSIGLLGREALWIKVFCGIIGAWLIFVLCSQFGFFSDQAIQLVAHGAGWAVGLLSVVGTIGVFVAARRRLLIGWPTTYVGASVWAGLAFLVAMWWSSQTLVPQVLLMVCLGISALAVAPLAAAPLALSFNRNR